MACRFGNLTYFAIFCFLYAYRHKRIDIIDVFWGPSFILVGFWYVVTNIYNMNPAVYIALLCIYVWGTRLSSHIYSRFKSSSEQDKRYTEITKPYFNKPILIYLNVFAVQAILASLVMTVFMVATLSTKFSPVLFAGLALWIFGFVFEASADSQLKRHIQSKTGGLITTGLWKYSRHPNYFGEVTQWWAIWLMLSAGEFSYIGLVGPIVISFLIIFVSGIPPLEKHMAQKGGWQEYKKSTSMIIPWRKF